MRILLATDAWLPQVNGVVRTWLTSIEYLRKLGHEVKVIEPNQFPGMPCPLYPEIRLCLPLPGQIVRSINAFQPDVIHIATEGPIGLAVRLYCRRRGFFFTTSYHTKFPEYLQRLVFLPTRLSYGFMRLFHSGSSTIMVATPSLEEELRQHSFQPPLKRWSRGVDLELFHPRPKTLFDWPRPILLYVGRVSKEKSIEDFLKVNAPGTKVVVGDGPIRERLEKQYPAAKFLGYRSGQPLAECYANADLFVFPSKTDTFGLVMIEALASGLPVAAYPVVGPADIITQPGMGALDQNLEKAVERALKEGDPETSARIGRQYTWENCTGQLLANFVDVRSGRAAIS
ncbi:MAG: glycosyltransferase family 1 protein [Planctomycetes bacterium]|nr:glycosyltransferase family 1 protein [Planctomycetota bacterium]